MKNRVQYKIKAYNRKAGRYKRWYYIIAVITSVSAVVVPVVLNWQGEIIFPISKNVLTTILSLTVSIGVALQEIFRFREHWRNFDLIYANLRREQLLYSSKAGPYADIEIIPMQEEKNDKIDKDKMFVKNIEDLIKDERWETINLQTSSNRASEKSKG